MKSKPDIAPIKKIPVIAKISKAGEKEGDFPPDIQMNPNGQPPDDYVEDTNHHDSSKSYQH